MSAEDEVVRRTVELVLEPETRDDNGDLRLRGYAAVFNSPSEDIGFREVLMPGAFRSTLAAAGTDVQLLYQHDPHAILARQSAKNLRVWEDEKGLRFEATLPKTQLARDAVTLTRSGTVRHMSFAFSMRGGQERTEKKDGELWRYVSKIGQLHEISLVSEPAYTSTSVEPRSAAALEAIRRHARPRDDGPYGPEKPYSYFRDLAMVGEARAGADALKRAGQRFEGELLDRGGAHPVHGTVEEARNRLKAVEKRALSDVSIELFSVVGPGPGFVGDLFAVAARTKAALSAALPHAELPRDLTVKAPRFNSGASVGYQIGENLTLSNTDPTTGAVSANVTTIAGYVDAARQDLDQAPGNIVDRAIATDLGYAFAELLEKEVINGAGASEEILGLLNTLNIGAVTFTSGAPTPALLYPKIAGGYANMATAYGAPPDAIVIHPRRRVFLEQLTTPWRWPAPVIETAGIPTTLGAGTEDAVLFMALAETYLMTGGVHFDVLTEINSSTLGVKFRAYGYAALLARQLKAITALTGSGLAAPVF
jgi:uncharacterized protein